MNFSQAFNPLRSFKSVFETMNLRPAHLWGGGILLFFLEGAMQASLQSSSSLGEIFGEKMLILFVCGGCIVGLGIWLASIWLSAGLSLNFRSVMRTGEVTTGGIFDPQGLFLPLLLTRLLVALASVLVVLPIIVIFGVWLSLVIPGSTSGASGPRVVIILVGVGVALVTVFVSLYVGLGLMLSEGAVLFEGHRPVEAVKRSWALAKGNRLQLFLFVLVSIIFTLCGILLCCVGVLATATITRFALLEGFLQLAETQDESSAAQLEPSEL